MRIIGLRPCRTNSSFQHRDFFRPLADLQIGKLRLRLCECRFGLRHGNPGIRIFHGGDWLAGLDTIAALYRNIAHLRHLERGKLDEFALHIANRQRLCAASGKKR